MARVQPVHPKVVDPTGVQCSNEPRHIPQTTDDSRMYEARTTGGLPKVQFESTSNPYVDYQFIDLLHTLQAPRSEAYDEMCFILMGQTKELLFQALHFELFNARHQVDHDELAEAIRMLGRARQVVRCLSTTWDVLSTITVDGFNEFRNGLGQASGQLSFMYRHVEFVLGNKSERLAQAHANIPHVWPQLEAALHAPSLYDRVIALIARNGFEVSARALDHDWSQPYEPDASVEAAWLEIYRQSHTENGLYELGEAMIALDDDISLYRWRHFTSVARIIGDKPGTGGSSGVGWLRHVTEHRFFPELWSVRTLL
jgi:tryptophan 2,3-dioxygenase